jgi:Spherulation-specific family 4
MGLDGIFIDEVDCEGEQLEYFATLVNHVKTHTWRAGNSGTCAFVPFSLLGFVVLNPGCAPRHEGYYDIADLVIVFEHFTHNFVNPPLNDPAFEYLADGSPDGGMTLMLPQVSSSIPKLKLAVMVHDFFSNLSPAERIKALEDIVSDLVQRKCIGAVFFTDVQIEKEDIYAKWSSFWTEFVDAVVNANRNARSERVVPDFMYGRESWFAVAALTGFFISAAVFLSNRRTPLHY